MKRRRRTYGAVEFIRPSESAEVAELADAHDSKSCEVTPHVGSIPTFGMGEDASMRPRKRSNGRGQD